MRTRSLAFIIATLCVWLASSRADAQVQLQLRVTGTCTDPDGIKSVNADGTVSCTTTSVGGAGTANFMTQWTAASTIGSSLMATDGNGDLKYGSGALALWSSTSLATGIADTGIARNAAGVIEIDTGIAGTLAGLLAATVTVQTGTGQAALFSTTRATSTDGQNACIGGGCQSVAYDGTNSYSGSYNSSLGEQALTSLTTGNDNSAFGEAAAHLLTSGQQNTAIGFSALPNATSGSGDSGFGGLAGSGLTTGSYNSFVGYQSGGGIATGSYNTIVGANIGGLPASLANNVVIGDGSGNIRWQDNAGSASTSSSVTVNNSLTVKSASTAPGALIVTPRPSGTDGNNVCVGGGCTSLAFNATVGSHSASSITTLGIGAANAFGSGADTVAIGSFALDSAAGSQATQITAVGASAMINANGAIGFDTAVGQGALENITSGDNTALGQAAMLQQTSGGSNTAVGVQALEGGTGATCQLDVAVGLASNQLCTTGAANTAVGYQAMANATSASSNVAVGYNAAGSGTMTGNRNTCVGVNACSPITSGYGNAAFGNQAGSGITTGSQNTFIGPINASFVGTGAGITTGNYNTIIGSVTGLSSSLSSEILVADGSGDIRVAADQYGHIALWGTAQSSTNLSSCGTGSPTVKSGSTDVIGQITEGTTATGCTMAWAGTPSAAPFCSCTANAGGTAVACDASGSTTSHLVIVNASATGDVITYVCFVPSGNY